MKDNHHITQNQTVKININTGGNKPSKRRSKPRPKLGGLGGGGGGGGGGLGGGFSIPPIIHNDNKPDTSAIEDTLNKQENSLQRIYDNQMTQHHYSNFIRDGYAHFPQIDAPHFTNAMRDAIRDINPSFEVIKNRVDDDVDDSDDDSDGGGAGAGDGAGAGAGAGAGDGAGGGGGGDGGGGDGGGGGGGGDDDDDDEFHIARDEPPSPPLSVQRALRFGTPKPFKGKVGKLRRDVTERTEKQVTDRVKREVYKLRRIPDDDPDKEVLLRNIKVDINHVFRQSNGTVDLKRLLPAIYH
jgi:hypothetical protein